MIQIRHFNRLVKGQLYLCLFAIALLTIFSCSTQQTEFFISPNGNDQNSGSITQPFATLERARNAIREAKDKNDVSPTVGFKVYLREGEFVRRQCMSAMNAYFLILIGTVYYGNRIFT